MALADREGAGRAAAHAPEAAGARPRAVRAGRRAGARRLRAGRLRRATPRSSCIASGSEVQLAVEAHERLSRRGRALARREPRELASSSRIRTRPTATRSCRRLPPPPRRRGGRHVRLGALGRPRRRHRRPRPLRRVRPRHEGPHRPRLHRRQRLHAGQGPARERSRSLMPGTLDNRLAQLQRFGQSPWFDYISRQLVAGGKLQRLIDEDGLGGMTSQPLDLREGHRRRATTTTARSSSSRTGPRRRRRSSIASPSTTCAPPATCSRPCTWPAAAPTASSPSRCRRAWPATRRAPSTRRTSCSPPSTGPT